MKIKITCRPRYNPWLKKYLNSKAFSKMLALGVLINSVPINSFAGILAGILSDDGRYETFEGSDITINDILEEDKVDVEIEGNTLVNLINSEDYSEMSEGSIVVEGDYSNWGLKVISLSNNIKPNTTYTLFANIKSIVLPESGKKPWIEVFNNNIHINGYSNPKSYITFKTSDSPSNKLEFRFIVADNRGGTASAEFNNIMLLEGDWTNKEIPRYFKGMKSVGQKESGESNLDIISLPNENLVPKSNCKFTVKKDKEQTVHYISVDNIVAQKFIGKEMTLSFDVHSKGSGKNSPNNPLYDEEISRFGIHGQILWTSSKNPNINTYTYPLVSVNNYNLDKERVSVTDTIIAPNGYDTILSFGLSIQPFRMPSDDNDEEWYIANPKLEYGGKATTWIPNVKESIYLDYIKNYTLNITLNEPLRGLPNGVKDRITKKNGQWVVERNCKEVILDGSKDERWELGNAGVNITGSKTISFQRPFDNIEYKDVNNINIISDRFPSYTHAYSNNITEDKEWIRHYSNTSTNVGIRILKSKLSSETIEGFEEWLSNNPLTVVYELQEPVYEPIEIDSLSLYLDTTHISTNSTIPANLKVTVDRVANRAKEYSELAKENPTIENISLARMWTNLMRESILKDEFQDNVDSITEITDMTLERKTASANLDVYIKSENALMMNLSTNSITFDDFSGVEDMIKENAVNITINSSLPYNLNAYLATDIQNSDKSVTMNKDILSIKDNSELDYQTFNSTNNKIILKENCVSGNDKQHDINLKLNGGIAHEKGIYKTTIKFEAEQK